MIKNNEKRYGSVAKWFHWLTAFLVLISYVSIYYLHWMLDGEGPQRGPIIGFHKAVGVTVLLFTALRLFWRSTNPGPKLPDTMPNWQIRASHLSHFLLYCLLFAMPISGYLGNGSGVDYYGLFKVAAFKDTLFGIWTLDLLNITFEQWEVPFDFFHYKISGPLLMWMIITVHGGAGLYHHYVEKDEVLKRMLPGNSR